MPTQEMYWCHVICALMVPSAVQVTEHDRLTLCYPRQLHMCYYCK